MNDFRADLIFTINHIILAHALFTYKQLLFLGDGDYDVGVQHVHLHTWIFSNFLERVTR